MMLKRMRKMFGWFLAVVMMMTVGHAWVADGKTRKGPAPKAAVSKAKEMENTLMNQLQPLPKMNRGEKIGVLVITLANPYWVGMKNAYLAAGRELGVNVEVMAAPTEGDTRSQLETLQAMTAKDYKALILSPIEPFNLVPGVVEANRRGIKVVNLGPPISEEHVVKAGGKIDGRITVDFEGQGEMAAKYIAAKLAKAGGKVAIIQGIPGAGQSEGRTAGAKSVLEKTAGIQLVAVQPANWDRNTAYNVASNLIQANPDLKAIFCCNDVMALAAADALIAAGQRKDRIIFGVDFIPEAKEAIKSGKLNGSIAYSIPAYAKAGLVLALKTVQGHKIQEVVHSPLAAVTRENIQQYLDFQ